MLRFFVKLIISNFMPKNKPCIGMPYRYETTPDMYINEHSVTDVGHLKLKSI